MHRIPTGTVHAVKPDSPRIALVHALRESIEPIRQAFAADWPEAQTFNVLDDSLSAAASACGGVSDEISSRFVQLARYAAAAEPGGRRADGMLITSSAFGKAIRAVKRDLAIPVMGPYEATFEMAVQRAHRLGVLVTFEPSRSALVEELELLARRRRLDLQIISRFVPGALESLQCDDAQVHNAAIAAAARQLDDCDLIVLGQFSMAQAVKVMPADIAKRVLTTPAGAVSGMRAAVLTQLVQ